MKLRQADVDVISERRCGQLWEGVPISSVHICVYDEQTNSRGACNVSNIFSTLSYTSHPLSA